MQPANVALDHHLARGLLRNAVTWLELEAEAGQRHGWRAREIGAVAILGGFGGLAARAERLLDDDKDGRDPVLPHGAELAEMYPPYDPQSVFARVRRSPPAHLQLVLEREFDRAWMVCADDGQREEVIAMRALLGDLDGAAATLERAQLSDQRHLGPMMVIAIEAARAGEAARTRQMILDELGNQDGLDWWVPVAAGLLGRLPWDGYPLHC
ncbi:hypothetical protein G6O69_06485 [Pseudenhygromyxa sp. WMMC2535]|uniref:hypothetical protein n=1 Tax=Pseudenhygromyxa sp. WMMC2535 TaxID=2712867 RepID=UPI001555566E|nr:hypothetical protein [Pseudenhygromyxa sp. WMMC2535]NVB37472.1 hypothetical protein [Pseudenhygromyxa sp. WMMC2535]